MNTRSSADRVRASDRTTRVLSVSSVDEDHADLLDIVEETPFRVTVSRDCRDAANQLDEQQFGIVVCECHLPDGAWTDVLRQISRRPEQPLLIVSSRLADDFLWAEVLNLGGFDLLIKPFSRQEVRHVLTTALTHLQNHCAGGPVAGAA
jgi:DNA-binding response OmpR family regulator